MLELSWKPVQDKILKLQDKNLKEISLTLLNKNLGWTLLPSQNIPSENPQFQISSNCQT